MSKSNPPSTPPVDSITLDSIINTLIFNVDMAGMDDKLARYTAALQAKSDLKALHTKELLALIGPDNGFIACDDLHPDAYKVQPRIKASLRRAIQAREEQ